MTPTKRSKGSGSSLPISLRYENIIRYFQQNMPVAESELVFSNAYQLLVAVILSAQCTDRRVNMTTPVLFGKYPDAFALAKSTEEDIYAIIKSISYPHNKARHLSELGKRLVRDFDGEVPSDIDSLMSLPGVGRKTANVVASIIFNKPVIAVDTHVFRVAHRLGLSEGKTPEAVERDLERYVKAELRPICHHWLILFGRYTCTALKPHCDKCGLKSYCKRQVDDLGVVEDFGA